MKKLIIYMLLLTYFTANIGFYTNVYATESDTSSKVSSSDTDSDQKSDKDDDNKDDDKKTLSKKSDKKDDKDKDKDKDKKDKDDTDSKDDDEDEAEDEEEVEEYFPHANLMLMVDGDTDLVMFEQKADKEFNPGSLVKILTAITVIETCEDLSEKLSVPEGLLIDFDYDLANIGLRYGESLSIQTLLEAMIVYDAGDCALVLANECGKSYSQFIESMNTVAKRIGAKNSKFTDPVGYDDESQKTTLNDMYKIAKYAMQNETFAKIAKKDYMEIPPTNKYPSKRILYSSNRFLTKYYSDKHVNSNIAGIKSYYTSDDDCGIIANYKGKQSNLYILCAQSDSDEDEIYSYCDVEYLIEYAGYNFSLTTLVGSEEFVHEEFIANGKGTNKLLVITETPIQARLPHNYDSSKIKKDFEIAENIKAPIQKREKLGTLTVYYDGLKCGETNLLAYTNIESSAFSSIKHHVKNAFGSIWFKLIIILIIALFVIKTFNLNRRKNKKK